jgi:hypothetical protein
VHPRTASTRLRERLAVYHDRGRPPSQLLQVQVLPSEFGNQRSTSAEVYTGGCRSALVLIEGVNKVRVTVQDALNRLLIRMFVISYYPTRPFGPTSTRPSPIGINIVNQLSPCRNLGPSARNVLE